MKALTLLLAALVFIRVTTLDGFPAWVNTDDIVVVQRSAPGESGVKAKTKLQLLNGSLLFLQDTPESVVQQLPPPKERPE